ncbi:YecA family protein [Stappia indica]|uniref:SEC-C motif-containing protein n=1 Tax=Stappia indica TaxID=538381 RepID=A0A285R9L0_9HYPH|nr:SEC-C domain-containing protein [Stappia indica]SOB89102.1 SEC-C motif-containing protein [Stappia indica]
MAKVGRNQLCPCGSKKKYKHCCGNHYADFDRVFSRSPFIFDNEADEKIRQNQQGLGKPIISAELQDRRVIAVGDRLYFSKGWKTFPDFLDDYIKDALGADWGNAEIAKPEEDRHQIIKWYQSYCIYQKQTDVPDGQVRSADVNGLIICYLGLAYNLYLLEHNVELQARMITRLKDRSNFQGAFYELIVAGALIRAGYELVLEDEDDRRSKHCEFAAINRSSGKRYSVEAKMRSVNGLLGKTEMDGGSDKKPLGKLITHLHGALSKPSAGMRLLFVDINAPMDPAVSEEVRPAIIDAATKKIIHYEGNPQAPDETAYVFITNVAVHRYLDLPPVFVVAPIGFRIPDFNRPGEYGLAEKYRADQKHKEIFDIADALAASGKFPTTFDGSLPSDNFGNQSQRLRIGQTYHFSDAAPGGLIGTVQSANVIESKKTVYILAKTPNGNCIILSERMSEASFRDYIENKDFYFGEIQRGGKNIKTEYELFCELMGIYADYERGQLAAQLGMSPEDLRIANMTDQQLREFICEQLVVQMAS